MGLVYFVLREQPHSIIGKMTVEGDRYNIFPIILGATNGGRERLRDWLPKYQGF